jgi:hypothetical protein
MKELLRYYLAFIQYKIARRFPSLRYFLRVHLGYCYHFNSDISFRIELPTLYYLRPDHRRNYWFERGDLNPRIDLLEMAIKEHPIRKKLGNLFKGSQPYSCK